MRLTRLLSASVAPRRALHRASWRSRSARPRHGLRRSIRPFLRPGIQNWNQFTGASL